VARWVQSHSHISIAPSSQQHANGKKTPPHFSNTHYRLGSQKPLKHANPTWQVSSAHFCCSLILLCIRATSPKLRTTSSKNWRAEKHARLSWGWRWRCNSRQDIIDLPKTEPLFPIATCLVVRFRFCYRGRCRGKAFLTRGGRHGTYQW